MWEAFFTLFSPFVHSRRVRLYAVHIPTAVMVAAWPADDWHGILRTGWVAAVLLLLFAATVCDLLRLKREQPDSRTVQWCVRLIPAVWLVKAASGLF